jgi:hypothetical protein
VIEDAVSPVGADGFVVSGQADVVAETVDFGETFPAASKASTASEYPVPHASPVKVYVRTGSTTVARRVLPRYTP